MNPYASDLQMGYLQRQKQSSNNSFVRIEDMKSDLARQGDFITKKLRSYIP
jgi:hypothetical protein